MLFNSKSFTTQTAIGKDKLRDIKEMNKEIRKLKCKCCKWYDNFESCEVIDCEDSFEISIPKIKEVANEEDISITDILNLIKFA